VSTAPERQDVPASPLRQIDLVAERFEQQWRQGAPPPIADFLGQAPAELRLQLLVELVCIDLEHRLRKRLPVALADYFRAFPELDELGPAERADLESHARARCRELGSTTEFARADTEPVLDCPPLIGSYAIAGHLATGGQADVFLSVHPRLLVPVVVKWLRDKDSPDEERGQRLVREGQVLANLAPHPNLVRVYDLGLHEGRPFLVLEHVQGHSLAQHGLGERPPPRRAAELVAALAEAVHKAHEQGVIHQDITPGNVIVDGRGQPRLIDFGLAWFRPPWTLSAGLERPDAGTPRFLSPEQADSQIGPIDRRTDVFGLGALLYYLLTERPLYNGTTQSEVLRQAAEGAYDATALDRAGVPRRLAAVCRKALARNPQDRFHTAAELAAALRASVRRPRWHRAAGYAALLLVLFLAAVGVGWLLRPSARQGPDSALHANEPALAVRVWRPITEYTPLSDALPVKTGDELQVRIRVPAGLHVGLFWVNGQGQLVLLEQYPPREEPAELIYPAEGKTRSLEPPAGTELLLVCGRPADPVSQAEVRGAWGDAPWPAVNPRRLLRLQASRVKDEGEKPRDFGATRDRPESDPVVRRLDELRQRLTPKYSFFEGLVFRHE
jgi:tRNA A-37 threonylcarbamoyl transferase component Bud32